jgi:ABC-type lipoprotein release transport system permease subunit
MNPVVKRILVHGGMTAVFLAVIGFVFIQWAAVWITGAGRLGTADAAPPLNDSFRYRVPLTMAFWGFVFVAVTELVLSRMRGTAPAKPAAALPPDEAETLLNELLAQAESKMAAEAASKAEGQESEKRPEGEQPKPSPG